MPASAVFLPLTLGVIAGLAELTPGRRALAEAARRTESDAWAIWQALLGGCVSPAGTRLPGRLRRLSGAVGTFTGAEWWHGVGRAHRDRAGRYQRWLRDSLTDGDGAGFAEAFAGYDAALAHAMVSAVAAAGGPDAAGERARVVAARPYGTMAQWLRRARAVTSRATHRAVHPLRWATNRPATSSSRWSRRSRSGG